MKETLQRIIQLLSKKEQKKGIYVLVLFLGMSFLEMIGVASIMPFLALLGDPGLIESSQLIGKIYHISSTMGLDSLDEFFIFLGTLSVLMIFFSGCYKLFSLYEMNRFIEMRRHSISSKLLETYLQQPYSFFLSRHSADLSKTILSEVDHFIGSVFRPVFTMISYFFVLITILTLVIFINPYIAFITAFLMGLLYGIYFLFAKNKVLEVGNELTASNKIRFTKASDTFGAIKIIKLLRCEKVFLKMYQFSSERFSSSIATHHTIGSSPKFIIETFAFGTVIVFLLWIIISKGGLESGRLGEILPIIGLYVFSAYKIQPSLQHIFHGINSLKYGQSITNNLFDDLKVAKCKIQAESSKNLFSTFSSTLSLDNVSFSYHDTKKPSLDSINLDIEAGQSVGIIGKTGAGKTTLVDIILGLLSPTEGNILIDGVKLNASNKSDWQNILGYVPQEIVLNDSTISQNIALGIDKDLINQNQVQKAAEQAQIHDFIINELKLGYETVVGERGIRLSGGQRQRIGIARALYRNPQILILDEATSALDLETERDVMNSIKSLSNNKTTITIAHRMSTVKNCEKIVFLEKGKVKKLQK